MSRLVTNLDEILSTGMETTFTAPQKLQNWTVDNQRLTTRLGYEKFNTAVASYAPFTSTGVIHSLFMCEAYGVPYIIIEADKKLYFVHETSGSGIILAEIISGWEPPGNNGSPTIFQLTAHGVIAVNGRNAAILIRLEPLGNASEATVNAKHCVEPVGYASVPAPIEYFGVNTVKYIDQSARGDFNLPSIWLSASPSARGVSSTDVPAGLGLDNNDLTKYKPAGEYETCYCERRRDGSFGPLSSTASVKWKLEPETRGRKYMTAATLPQSPSHVIHRDIYRTKNALLDAERIDEIPGIMYFTQRIEGNDSLIYYDSIALSYQNGTISSSSVAPINGDSIPFPCAYTNSVASVRNSVFYAGGYAAPSTVYYTRAGTVHQISATNVFTFTDLGKIQHLHAFADNIIVFGTRGVGIISPTNDGSFQARPLFQDDLLIAPNTVKSVGSNSVYFLSTKGLYRIELRNGTISSATISASFETTFIELLNPSFINRACAVYDSEKKEYSCYFTSNASAYNDAGFVVHLHLGEQRPLVSTRDGFPVASIAIYNNRYVMFGHSNPGLQRGLFVISGHERLGGAYIENTYVPGVLTTSELTTGYMVPSVGTGMKISKIRFVVEESDSRMEETTLEIFGSRNFNTERINIKPGELKPPKTENSFSSVYGAARFDSAAYWLPVQPIIFESSGTQTTFKYPPILQMTTTDSLTLDTIEVEYE